MNASTNDSNIPSYEQLKKEVERRDRAFRNWLTWALVHYVVINLFLVGINWFTSPHYWWVLWVIISWGVSLLINAIRKSIEY
ncbi:2TM domain-containing protein [Phocaeicola sp.]